jgi:hypothetical protein
MDTLSNQTGATFGIAGGNATSLDNANYWYNAGTFTVTGTLNTDDTPGVINRENADFINASTANTTFSSSGYNALVFKNEGYLESSSALTIKNSGKGLLVNTVKGEIVNNAVLTLSNCTTDAFTNLGKFTNNATGTLVISNNGGNNYQINNSGTFKSVAGCTITLNSGSKGVINNDNGNFSNKCITSFGAKGGPLLENLGTYIHDAGSIAINGGTASVFNNKDTMQIDVPIAINQRMTQLMINSGIFTVGVNTVVSVATNINTGVMITNSVTGTFNSNGTFTNIACSGMIANQGTMTLGTGSKITGVSMETLITNSGNLTNEGKLSFRKGSYPLYNSGTFSNKGSFYSANTTNGIYTAGNATIENSGTMTIDSVFNQGIQQGNGAGNSFTNTTTGKIIINYTLANGILNSAGTFTNNGLVRIGDYGMITLDAVKNTASLINGEGGRIYLNGAAGSGINNDGGTISNQACAAIESILPIVNTSGTFTNAGLIRKLQDTRTIASNIGANTGTIVNDDTDPFTYTGSNGALPPTVEITSGNGVLYTGETRTLTATPSGGVFDVTGPATVDGNTLTATGTGIIVVSYTILGGDNCKYTASQIIEPLTIKKITIRPAGCNDVTGSITVITSAVGTFEYSKDGINWQPDPTLTGLAAGSYNISARLASAPDYLATYAANPVELVTYQPVTSVVIPAGDITTSYTCQTGEGWTLYTNDIGTETYFGVKWNGNEAAKSAAVITLKTTDQTEKTLVSSTSKGTFTLPKYWNVDIGSNTLTNPVSVTFSYSQADKELVIANANQFATDNNVTATNFVWFKTTNVPYNPAVHLLATGIGGNSIELTGTEGEVNGIKQITFTGITSFSGGTGVVGVGSGSALPVTLVSFSGKPAENRIILNWKTTSELNAHSFEIQRGFNAKSFEKIGQVRATGTTRELSVYEFNDSLPKPGLNYYRLKQLDRDGTFAYSKTIAVTWDGSNTLTLYPNPASEQIELKLPQSSGVREIVILDSSGKVIKTIKQPGRVVSVRGLASGLYFMKIATSDQVFTQKFIKISR